MGAKGSRTPAVPCRSPGTPKSLVSAFSQNLVPLPVPCNVQQRRCHMHHPAPERLPLPLPLPRLLLEPTGLRGAEPPPVPQPTPRRCSLLSWGANPPVQDSPGESKPHDAPACTYTLFGAKKKAFLVPNINILWLYCSRRTFGMIRSQTLWKLQEKCHANGEHHTSLPGNSNSASSSSIIYLVSAS